MTAHANTPGPAFISFADVSRRTSLSRSSVERLVAAKAFPQPVVVSAGRRAFVADEIERWVEERIAAREYDAGSQRIGGVPSYSDLAV